MKSWKQGYRNSTVTLNLHVQAVNTNCPSENKEAQSQDKALTMEEYLFSNIEKLPRWKQQMNKVQAKILKPTY